MTLRLDACPHLPELYPDFTRRAVAVPTRGVFEQQTEFSTLRVFTTRDNRLVDWKRDLDLYTEELGLGRVIWPLIYTIFTENFSELVEEIKHRKLWLFDIWGHVPGSAPEGMWAHIVPPKGMAESLRLTLGDRFLGFDNGEQDGRYIGLYATQQCPLPTDGFNSFLNFHRHFRRLGDDMGNQLSVLTSLQFVHHFAREGNHLLLGAETAQALPNSQIYYSFIRGAGKQHGLLWFGNASVFNRWGYKSYEGEGESYGLKFGPDHGTSLSLLRRLLYSHILYGCSIVGFENNWVLGDDNEKRLRGESVLMQSDDNARKLSPIGEIQADAVQWTRQHGDRGTMLTPVGILLDVFSGWTVPRHLYVERIYQTWGGRPYNDGDHLTHGVMSLIYPGYEDAGYFRNEQGFISPTPFGDIADTLLSDAPEFVLHRYATIICAGAIEPTEELRDKLDGYVSAGGHLVLTAANARLLLRNIKWSEPQDIDAGPVAFEAGERAFEIDKFSVHALADIGTWQIVARASGQPVAITRQHGDGRITLLLSAFGLASSSPKLSCVNKVNQKLDPMLPLLNHVRHALSEILKENQLIRANPELATILCKDPGCNQYTLGLFNNTLAPKPVHFESRIGKILEQTEVPVPRAGVGARGYFPASAEVPSIDSSSAQPETIAAGDVRIFSLRIDDRKNVASLSPAVPPARPANRFISLRGQTSITETLLRWPTFFQHLDGIKIDWTYLRDRDPKAVEFEAQWLRRQSVRILVDFSSGLNFYPDLTLLDTFAPRYQESQSAIKDVLRKASVVGAEGVVFSLHRMPENHCDEARAADRFLAGAKTMCRHARANLGTQSHCYVTQHPTKRLTSMEKLLGFVDAVGEGLQAAWHMGHDASGHIADATKLDPRIGLLLAASGTVDALGQWYDSHAPACRLTDVNWSASVAAHLPIVLDSVHRSWDDAYIDIRAVFKSRHLTAD